MGVGSLSRTDDDATTSMFRAFIEVAHHGCPNSDVTAEHPGVRIKSVSGARTESGRKKQLLWLETNGPSLDAFVANYRSHDLVCEASLYPHDETDTVAHLSSAIDYSELTSVSGILSRHGAFRGHGATASRGTEEWWLFFESHDILGEIIRDLRAEGSEVSVLRKERMTLQEREERLPKSSLAELTARQREVLLLAVERGYFTPHSHVSLDDLASELDLSTSSIWEHLSKAKEQVIAAVAADAGFDVGER